MPRNPGVMDVITQPLYDKQTVLAAGTSLLTFFAVPVGQSGKTLADTNMRLAGQLPSPQSYEVRGVAVKLGAVCTAADAKTILATGFLTLFIGAKDWWTVPLELTSSGAGIVGFADGTASTNFAVTNGVADPRAIAMLTRPITINENENFSVTVQWPAAITPVANTTMIVALHGELTRSVQ